MTRTGLTAAFPTALAADVSSIEDRLTASFVLDCPPIEVTLGEEALSLPCRVYFIENRSEMALLSERARLIYSCIFTRHHDGYVRQWHLERILGSDEAWVQPFVFRLMGEYLIEILDVIEARLPKAFPPTLVSFLRQNPRYLQTTQSRMISYWDAYYRHLYRSKSDYVGFRLFKQLDQLLGTPT